MKVSYITMQFPVPSETFASLDVESLRKQGQDVSVYGMRPKHVQFESLMAERGHAGLPVAHFSFASLLGFLAFLLRHPLMAFSLLRWIFSCCAKQPKHLFKSLVLFPSAISIFDSVFKKRPDVVHLFWGHYPSMVGYLVKKYMPNTVVSMFLGAHDLVSAYPGSVKLSKDADVIFTHSKSNLATMAGMCIDVSRVNVVVRGTKLDFPYEWSHGKFEALDSPVFLTAARLIEEKGVDDVLRVFSKVLERYPEAKLNIAGDGPYKAELIKLAEDLGCSKNVLFLGHIKQTKLIRRMSDSHFFILMSRYPSERLPNVVKEAMYQQCVVLTTRTEGIDELVNSGVSGFIVDKGDYSTATELIIRCLSYPNEAQAIAVEAKKIIEQHFDVDKSMQEYIELWEATLKEKRLL